MESREIVGLEELAASATRQRARGKSIALCHGTFDLLHMGHIRHLQRARDQADLLFVSVTGVSLINRSTILSALIPSASALKFVRMR